MGFQTEPLEDRIEELEQQLAQKDKQLKILIKMAEHYAYPAHEDGDRAYIFGVKARRALEEVKEVK